MTHSKEPFVDWLEKNIGEDDKRSRLFDLIRKNQLDEILPQCCDASDIESFLFNDRDLIPVLNAAYKEYRESSDRSEYERLNNPDTYDYDDCSGDISEYDRALMLFCSYNNGIPEKISRKDFFKMLYTKLSYKGEKACKERLNMMVDCDIFTITQDPEVYNVNKEAILERFEKEGLNVSIEPPEGKTTVLWKYRGRQQ